MLYNQRRLHLINSPRRDPSLRIEEKATRMADQGKSRRQHWHVTPFSLLANYNDVSFLSFSLQISDALSSPDTTQLLGCMEHIQSHVLSARLAKSTALSSRAPISVPRISFENTRSYLRRLHASCPQPPSFQTLQPSAVW